MYWHFQGRYDSRSIQDWSVQPLAPSGMLIEQADISAIPLYNGDDDGDSKPEAVERLARQVQNADALLFATPEYNYSIPGVLKNAIDWLSRVEGSVFAGKPAQSWAPPWVAWGPVAVSITCGRFWCAWMSPYSTNRKLRVRSSPEGDDNGDLTDEKTRGMIAKQLQALKGWHAT